MDMHSHKGVTIMDMKLAVIEENGTNQHFARSHDKGAEDYLTGRFA
jgi:ABC-type phosphate transport system ATPase subunit